MTISWMIAAIFGTVLAAALLLPLYLASVRRAGTSLRDANADKDELISRAVQAETAHDMLEHARREALEAKTRAEAARDEALKAQAAAERRAALAEQQLAAQELRMQDQQAAREAAVRDAQAAIMKAGGDLSTKLLEDHKRELEAAKKANDESADSKNKIFLEQVEQLKSSVANLHGQTEQSTARLSTLWQAMTSPGGAGQLAEIGLANLLKNLGLEESRDFTLQHSMEGQQTGEGAKRPDALIYLPQNGLMVIDSKASKFLLDIASQAEATGEAAARMQLRNSMQTHLKQLAGREYHQAVEQWFKAQHGEGALGLVVLVMYLPSEAMLEQLKAADGEFLMRAHKSNIIVTGPSGLHGLLALASGHIRLQRQADNQEQIVRQATQLVEAAAVVISHIDKITRGIKSAAGGLDSVIKSVNSRLLPRIRNMQNLGVPLPKDVPHRVPGIAVQMDTESLIEGEVSVDPATSSILRVVQG